MGKLLIILTLGLMATACGKPETAAVATFAATPSVKAADVTQTFPYAQGSQACAALKAWDPSKTNIQYTADPGGYSVWLFTAVQVTQNGQAVVTVSITIGSYCTVLVSGSKIVSIQ